MEKRIPKPPPLERLRLQAAQEERLRLQGGQERLRKPPPTERQKRSLQVGKEDVQASKPLPEGSKKSPTLQETSKQSSLQAAEKTIPKPPPLERLRLQAAQEERLRLQGGQERLHKPPPTERQKRSSQVGKEDVQASKPLPEGSKKSPTLQETSKQSSHRRRLIMEEDDEMFSCNVDPFSEELVDRFEAQDQNKAAESDQSSQENCF